jgi:hypothetical protein
MTATDCRIHWREGVNPRCLCRRGAPSVCEEGKALALRESRAMENALRMRAYRPEGDRDRTDAEMRLLETRNRLNEHMRGETKH